MDPIIWWILVGYLALVPCLFDFGCFISREPQLSNPKHAQYSGYAGLCIFAVTYIVFHQWTLLACILTGVSFGVVYSLITKFRNRNKINK